jgi:prephenate dehydrogenase
VSTFNNLKIGVIGGSQGLGSWFVKFFREQGFNTTFSSQDAHSEYSSNSLLVNSCDVILLSVPISSMTGVLSEIFPYLNNKILIEVCSVKKFLIDKFHQLSHQHPEIHCQFYSIHPMFSNRIDGLVGQTLLLTHLHNTNNDFVENFKGLFTAQKAVWHQVDYIHHDKVMGVVQGLNHFNVFVSAKTLLATGLPLDTVKNFSSPAYRIFLVFFTRYVLQNPRLYAEIQLFNEYVTDVLKLFKAETEKLLSFVETKNEEAFVKYITEMQPYFLPNKPDEVISTHLIFQLGAFMNERNEA